VGDRVTARYLVRFDDVCPTMNWETWDRIEEAIDRLGLRPILAVVPDNRDPGLEVGPADERFWERVRGWQERGWTIGMHGYQHRYVTRERGVIGINARSEFAGLTREEQHEKLRSAMDAFRRQGVVPTVWVAPGHSFDATTVELLPEIGIRTVSDGLGSRPFSEDGVLWIPQQLWRFRRMPLGVWTVCCHPNAWRPDAVTSFLNDLAAYRDRITDVDSIAQDFGGRRRAWWEGAMSRTYLTMLLARRRLRSGAGPARVRA
jgi:predicted deacetylase